MKTTNEIKKSYKLNNTKIIMHYIALSGEISTLFLKELDIKNDNKHYIFNKGKYSKCFVNKRYSGLCGYQLTKKGINFLLSSDSKDMYYDYLVNAQGNVRKNIYEPQKRKRCHTAAELLFFMDKMGVEYLAPDYNSGTYFLPGSKFKILMQKKYNNGNESERYAIKSSRIYGILKANGTAYPLYVFYNEVTKLDYSIEIRTNTLININLNDNNNSNTKGIIIAKDTDTQRKIIRELFECKYSFAEKYRDKKYKIFKENMFRELNVSSLDNNGIQEIQYLINQKEIEERIKSVLKEIENRTIKDKISGIRCDTYFNGLPVIFLNVLEITKLRYFFDLVSERSNICGYIICFRNQREFITSFFEQYIKRIVIINLEDILLEESNSTKTTS